MPFSTNYDVVTFHTNNKETGKPVYNRIQINVDGNKAALTYWERQAGYWHQIPFLDQQIQFFVLSKERELLGSINTEGQLSDTKKSFKEELATFFKRPEMKDLGGVIV